MSASVSTTPLISAPHMPKPHEYPKTIDGSVNYSMDSMNYIGNSVSNSSTCIKVSVVFVGTGAGAGIGACMGGYAAYGAGIGCIISGILSCLCKNR